MRFDPFLLKGCLCFSSNEYCSGRARKYDPKQCKIFLCVCLEFVLIESATRSYLFRIKVQNNVIFSFDALRISDMQPVDCAERGEQPVHFWVKQKLV